MKRTILVGEMVLFMGGYLIAGAAERPLEAGLSGNFWRIPSLSYISETSILFSTASTSDMAQLTFFAISSTDKSAS